MITHLTAREWAEVLGIAAAIFAAGGVAWGLLGVWAWWEERPGKGNWEAGPGDWEGWQGWKGYGGADGVDGRPSRVLVRRMVWEAKQAQARQVEEMAQDAHNAHNAAGGGK